MSPRSRSGTSTRPAWQKSWIRPDRSTRSRKVSFPCSRRPMTRPATRRVSSSSAPGSRRCASARTVATSCLSGKRFGGMVAESRRPAVHRGPPRLRARYRRPGLPEGGRAARLGSGGFDLENLEFERATRCRDLDDLALLAAVDRLADRRLVRELVLGGIRLCGADDVVLECLLRVDV